jgi:hypothetical protein
MQLKSLNTSVPRTGNQALAWNSSRQPLSVNSKHHAYSASSLAKRLEQLLHFILLRPFHGMHRQSHLMRVSTRHAALGLTLIPYTD